MKRLTLLLPIALAACNSGGPTVTATNASTATTATTASTASTAEVADKVAAANAGGSMISAGRWEGKLTMHDVQMPNMDRLPPAVRERMMSRMTAGKPFVSCVTDEQIKARHGLFTGEAAKNCRYDHFTMAGGRIDSAMSCEMPNARMAMTMTGTYSPDAYHMDATSKTVGASTVGAMNMSMTIDAKRAGACRGTPDEQH